MEPCHGCSNVPDYLSDLAQILRTAKETGDWSMVQEIEDRLTRMARHKEVAS